MNHLYRFFILCLLASPVLGDEPSIKLNDFKSPLARKSVKTFTDRIDFLEQSMRGHVETATNSLRESLKAALEHAAKDGDLKETERISKFLQADSMPVSDKRPWKTGSIDSPGAGAEVMRVEEQLASLKPLIAIQQNDQEFVRSIVGKTYLVPMLNRNVTRRWTFNANGMYSVDNKIVGHWAVTGDRTILTRVSDEGYVNMFRFSPDGSTVDVRYIGMGDKSEWKHQGSVAR